MLSVYFNDDGFRQYKEEQYMLDISAITLGLDELGNMLIPFNELCSNILECKGFLMTKDQGLKTKSECFKPSILLFPCLILIN